MIKFFLVIFLVFLIDQLSKFFVIRYLASVSLIKLFSFFYLTYQENTGAAFSLLPGKNLFFVVASVLIIAVLFIWLVREKKYDFSFALIIGGALGNLFDRIIRGRVIDFLDFRIWPVFNLADSTITIGVLLIFWRLLNPKKNNPNCKS